MAQFGTTLPRCALPEGAFRDSKFGAQYGAGMTVKQSNSLRVFVSGALALFLSYSLLRPASVLSAILIRRHWPEAWFSGLIVWYADLLAVACSIAVAIATGQYTFQRPQR
jgi:hypothetical protein